MAVKITKKRKSELGDLCDKLMSIAGAQVSVFDLGKISSAAETVALAGGDQTAIEAAINAKIAEVRTN